MEGGVLRQDDTTFGLGLLDDLLVGRGHRQNVVHPNNIVTM